MVLNQNFTLGQRDPDGVILASGAQSPKVEVDVIPEEPATAAALQAPP